MRVLENEGGRQSSCFSPYFLVTTFIPKTPGAHPPTRAERRVERRGPGQRWERVGSQGGGQRGPRGWGRRPRSAGRVCRSWRGAGRGSPVRTTRADRRKAAGQEPRHFKTGVEHNLERRPPPRERVAGSVVAAPKSVAPTEAKAGAPRAKGLPRRGRARPSPEPRCGPCGRAAPTRRRPGLAYLRRPLGSPPLPGRPRSRPPALDPLRRPISPAPQPPASPTSAAAPPAPPPPARHEWLRKEPKAGRPRSRRAGKSRAEPEAGRGSTPAPSGRGSSGQRGLATRTRGGLLRALGRFLKSRAVRTKQNLEKIQEDPAGNHSIHRDVIGSWGC